jgi:hypothetical protein
MKMQTIEWAKKGLFAIAAISMMAGTTAVYAANNKTANNTAGYGNDLKEQCKNGGWKNFSNPSFKNQGECVSYFVSNKPGSYQNP